MVDINLPNPAEISLKDQSEAFHISLLAKMTALKVKWNKCKYKHVKWAIFKDKLYFRAKIFDCNYSRLFDTEREAGVAVDKVFIKHGKRPVNVLVPSAKK